MTNNIIDRIHFIILNASSRHFDTFAIWGENNELIGEKYFVHHFQSYNYIIISEPAIQKKSLLIYPDLKESNLNYKIHISIKIRDKQEQKFFLGPKEKSNGEIDPFFPHFIIPPYQNTKLFYISSYLPKIKVDYNDSSNVYYRTQNIFFTIMNWTDVANKLQIDVTEYPKDSIFANIKHNIKKKLQI